LPDSEEFFYLSNVNHCNGTFNLLVNVHDQASALTPSWQILFRHNPVLF